MNKKIMEAIPLKNLTEVKLWTWKSLINLRQTTKSHHIALLGIIVVLNDQTIYWNHGLSSGFGSFVVGFSMMIIGFMTMILILSEMSSALPFLGGTYTIVRCLVGLYYGYLLACSQLLMLVTLMAISVHNLSKNIVTLTELNYDYEPFFNFLIYVLIIALYTLGGKLFWGTSMIIAIFSVLFISILLSSSLAVVDISKHGIYYKPPDHNQSSVDDIKNGWFVGGVYQFMSSFPWTGWFFVGIDSLAYTCNDTRQPQSNTSKGIRGSFIVILITAIFILFITVSIPPGIYYQSSTNDPLYAAGKVLNLSRKLFKGLTIPMQFGAAFSLSHMIMKIIQALSISALIPTSLSALLGTRYHWTRIALRSLLLGCFLSFVMSLLIWSVSSSLQYLRRLVLLINYLSIIMIFIGFYVLRTKYQSAKREFTSPIGLGGALIASFIFGIGAIGVIGFHSDYGVLFGIFLSFVVIVSIYYFGYAMTNQKFTDEEMKLTFSSLVVQYNRRQLEKIRKGNHNKSAKNTTRNPKKVLLAAINKTIETNRMVKQTSKLNNVNIVRQPSGRLSRGVSMSMFPFGKPSVFPSHNESFASSRSHHDQAHEITPSYRSMYNVLAGRPDINRAPYLSFGIAGRSNASSKSMASSISGASGRFSHHSSVSISHYRSGRVFPGSVNNSVHASQFVSPHTLSNMMNSFISSIDNSILSSKFMSNSASTSSRVDNPRRVSLPLAKPNEENISMITLQSNPKLALSIRENHTMNIITDDLSTKHSLFPMNVSVDGNNVNDNDNVATPCSNAFDVKGSLNTIDSDIQYSSISNGGNNDIRNLSISSPPMSDIYQPIKAPVSRSPHDIINNWNYNRYKHNMNTIEESRSPINDYSSGKESPYVGQNSNGYFDVLTCSSPTLVLHDKTVLKSDSVTSRQPSLATTTEEIIYSDSSKASFNFNNSNKSSRNISRSVSRSQSPRYLKDKLLSKINAEEEEEEDEPEKEEQIRTNQISLSNALFG